MPLTLPQAKALWEQRFQDLIGQPEYWLDYQVEIEQFAEDWFNCQTLTPVSDQLSWTESAVQASITLAHGSDLLTLTDLPGTQHDTNVSVIDTLGFVDTADYSEMQLCAFSDDTLVFTDDTVNNIALSKVAADNLGLSELVVLDHSMLLGDGLDLSGMATTTLVADVNASDVLNWTETIDGEEVVDGFPPRAYSMSGDNGGIIFYPRGS